MSTISKASGSTDLLATYSQVNSLKKERYETVTCCCFEVLKHGKGSKRASQLDQESSMLDQSFVSGIRTQQEMLTAVTQAATVIMKAKSQGDDEILRTKEERNIVQNQGNRRAKHIASGGGAGMALSGVTCVILTVAGVAVAPWVVALSIVGGGIAGLAAGSKAKV